MRTNNYRRHQHAIGRNYNKKYNFPSEWYLVIMLYKWDQTRKSPARTILHSATNKGATQPKTVAKVMRKHGYDTKPSAMDDPGPWTYRCKVYLTSKTANNSPLPRTGSTTWSYVARKI